MAGLKDMSSRGPTEGAVGLDELVRVARVAVHLAVAVRDAAVAKEDHDLVEGLGREREVVPEVVGVLQVRLRVALLGVDKHRKAGRVAQEEDGRVVLRVDHERSATDKGRTEASATHVDVVPVALLGAELDGEAARVAGRVGGTALATDGREAGGRARLVADLLEELSAGQVGDVVGDLEDSVGSAALGVNNALAAIAKHSQSPSGDRTQTTTTHGMRSRSKWASRSMW